MSGTSLFHISPGTRAPLDPGFVPAVLANEAYRRAVSRATDSSRLMIALERENGLTCRADVDILGGGAELDADTARFVERHIKFLLWAHGGWKLFMSGPGAICDSIRRAYAAGGARAFDADLMLKAYGRTFDVVRVAPSQMPAPREMSAAIGGHFEGCRIGFDLGASDYKVAAVIDGEEVFSKEIPWQPSVEKDPQYHYRHVLSGLKEAAAHLPRVDAIGGSSAGIWVDNQCKVASLFRAVPGAAFTREISPMFLHIQREWGVPLVVVNDGDVSALAGALSLKRNAILGIAMGSSLAAGYLDRKGCITGQLNELAFTPVDFNPQAAADEWSGDRGTGALYFSQQAVNKLAPAAGFAFPADRPLPERLKDVQAKANAGDKAALDVFVTMGVYFGYAVAHYAEYYDFDALLVLGRVTSGRGGEVIMEHARKVLREEFPGLNERIALHVPDEKSRRVGQAVAAASLPELKPR